jgi:molybdopterin converting factor subunit 1
MKVQVKLFAVAHEQAGQSVVEVNLPERATVAQLRREIARQHPRLAQVVSHSMIALGAEYAEEEAEIGPHDEIACIPPVSGG